MEQWSGVKRAQKVELAAKPERLAEIFSIMAQSGAPICALFGGAARDADLGALWDEPRSIKDYDLRCWISEAFMSAPQWMDIFERSLLESFKGSSVERVEARGTPHFRHIVRWEGLELDISARPSPFAGASPADCAVNRALDADASLCSVAIASDMSAWIERLYAIDRITRELRFYPTANPERLAAYAERMIAKFPKLPALFLKS